MYTTRKLSKISFLIRISLNGTHERLRFVLLLWTQSYSTKVVRRDLFVRNRTWVWARIGLQPFAANSCCLTAKVVRVTASAIYQPLLTTSTGCTNRIN